MEKPSYRLLGFVLLFIAAILYGTSYQLFRHFDLERPVGLPDARDYVKMEKGDLCDVPATRRHRFVVPWLAAGVESALAPLFSSAGHRPPAADPAELTKLSFYIVNFAITGLTALLLFLLLQQLGFQVYLALLGLALFLSSRIVIISAATPLVDSFYFFSVAAICYLSLADRLVLLALLNPLLVLSKETIVPIMLLPFFRKSRRLVLGVSLVAALAGLAYSRYLVLAHCGETGGAGATGELLEVLRMHAERISLQGRSVLNTAHDLQNGFSLFLIFALAGFFVNRKSRRYPIPGHFLWLVPLALVYALLSGNLGRMFFTAFPVVIPYALVFIEHALSRLETPAPPAGRTEASSHE